jgi:predicted GH43/DUF377 family glycosyl hydrolase
MKERGILDHYDVTVRPDPERTVVRPFEFEYPPRFSANGASRVVNVAERVLQLEEADLDSEIKNIIRSLDERHRDVDEMLDRRFDDIAKHLPDPDRFCQCRRRLIGAYCSEEYSFEATALFNPSAAITRDQNGVPEGGVRFFLTLRGIGEGHVSSATFRTGIWIPGGELTIEPASRTAVPPIVEHMGEGHDGWIRLNCHGSRDVSESVLFPVLPSQRQGIEDLRMVRFIEDDGDVRYYATYTAFSGAEARPELLSGVDWRSFDMRPLDGDAAQAKGMALFPRRVGGKYAMLGRQDSESIWLHLSDDLYIWHGCEKIISPKYPWEFVQMGNCGSPMEIDEGWLVLTHGVGTVRNYCMGACLLDKDDPSKVLARTPKPILEPSEDERDGYVPNVVYSCGALIHGRDILLPFGVADNFTAFASTTADRIVAAME